MTAQQDAALIQAALDVLRLRQIPGAVYDVATTPLTELAGTRRWLTDVARHVARNSPCCQGRSGSCSYSLHALNMSRGILDAAASAEQLA